MSRRQVLEIARWEFSRYFKLRDLVITILLITGITAASWGFSWWQNRSLDTVRVAVVSPIPIAERSGRIVFEPHEGDALPALRAAVDAGELGGVLVIELSPAPAVRLVVDREPAWRDDVEAAATAALHAHRIAQLGVSAEELAAALAPIALELELPRGATRAGSARLAAILAIGAMLATLFFGLTYLFMGITGEKQQRVTEQVFVMTSPQALVDGKLLGVGVLAVVITAQTAGIGVVAWDVFGGDVLGRLRAGLAGVAPSELAILAAFAVLGFAFWFTLSAAWFATIADPSSSARSNALLLPFVPLSAVFIGLSNPDSPMMQVLGFLPITSMTVMPARVVLGEVPLAHVIASLALLAGATFWLRRAAARIYEAAMLMYGKEPSLREMLRWTRRARAR
jgi:ABC-2 type transport system permease protein